MRTGGFHHSRTASAPALPAAAPQPPTLPAAAAAAPKALPKALSGGYWVSHNEEEEEEAPASAPSMHKSDRSGHSKYGGGGGGSVAGNAYVQERLQYHEVSAISVPFIHGIAISNLKSVVLQEVVAKQDAVLNEMAVAMERLQHVGADIHTELEVQEE